jgi:Kef-type K+ transport system membrane component KefB
MGLALVASLVSVRVALSVALIEILVGAVAGNLFPLEITPWVDYLAGVGAIVLTFLAGAEIDHAVIRRHFWASVSIGLGSFAVPFVGVVLYARYVSGWMWPQAQIGALSMSTTSVAVVYAVMLETGFNRTEMGRAILAAVFITDVVTVFVLGALFASYNLWLVAFAGATALTAGVLPRFVPWYFSKVGNRISEPEIKFVLLVLFALGWLANVAKSEAVLPAYLVGMVLAPIFLRDRILAQRMRIIAFTLLTPFYFLKAGALIKFDTVAGSLPVIMAFLAAKMVTKFGGVWPFARGFGLQRRETAYTTLLMCTGLTFGSICALFGLNHGIIDQDQYTILVTAVIGSAVVPTFIAQKWFQPMHLLSEEGSDHG